MSIFPYTIYCCPQHLLFLTPVRVYNVQTCPCYHGDLFTYSPLLKIVTIEHYSSKYRYYNFKIMVQIHPVHSSSACFKLFTSRSPHIIIPLTFPPQHAEMQRTFRKMFRSEISGRLLPQQGILSP